MGLIYLSYLSAATQQNQWYEMRERALKVNEEQWEP